MSTVIVETKKLSQSVKRARYQAVIRQLLLFEKYSLVPKGYTKRAAGGHIKYETIRAKINELYGRCPEQVKTRKVNGMNVLFVEKTVLNLPGF